MMGHRNKHNPDRFIANCINCDKRPQMFGLLCSTCYELRREEADYPYSPPRNVGQNIRKANGHD